MSTTKISELIRQRCTDNKIYVLRGFPIEVMKSLEYNLIDYDFLTDDCYIDLSKVKGIQVFNKVLQASHYPCYMMMESMIALTSTFRHLDELDRQFCIVDNNFLVRYVNPSKCDIPDFESSSFQSTSDNGLYSLFYSYCEHKGEKVFVNYVDPDLTGVTCVSHLSLLEPSSLDSIQEQPSDVEALALAGDNDSLQDILEQIFNGSIPTSTIFAITKNSTYSELLGVLVTAIELFSLNITLYWLTNPKDHISIRADLFKTLKSIWNYNSFRQLKIYKDLDFNRSVTTISQGEVIETVVRESENAINGKPFKNVILTSPTGSGKSLLFQLSAIYLANKYQRLTIVVSPLIALMEDQVNNLAPLYSPVATLNSNKSAAESIDIIKKVKEGSINILYLAPELLLSRSLESLIGTRKVGLIVIDEAHTVTTWGRDFRVDYWFLGDYLRATKRYLDHTFPTFALTATAVWDPSRKNDMVFETISSLNMDPCIKYIGVVRRDNIKFEIGRPEKVRDYERQRQNRTSDSILEAINLDQKTIVYFPYITTIRKILDHPNLQSVRLKITEFHSKLSPIEKKTNASNFKNGNCSIMCASKAFGMGVDVPDITKVYHHAPTGNLSDYIQEIGRLARDENLIGIAKIDFNEQDFKYTRQLHGLSTIKPYQLEQVLRKLMELYFIKGEKRNMMISPADFAYIFPNTEDLDQKFKSSLLLISHDLVRNLRFPALIVRAKNMFADIFIQVSPDEIRNFAHEYSDFVEPLEYGNGKFLLRGEKFWNDYFSNISFAQFKKKLMSNQIFRRYHVNPVNRIDLNLNYEISQTELQLRKFFKESERILGVIAGATAGQPRHIKYRELKEGLIGFSMHEKDAFLHSFILAYATPLTREGSGVCCQVKIKEDENNNQISLLNHGYESIKTQMLSLFSAKVTECKNSFYCSLDDPTIRMAELMNSLGLATFQRLGGTDPQVFVRINNPGYLHDLINRGQYTNQMLFDIYEKYKYSEEVFTYFFNTDMTDEQRWDFIEAYFLGAPKEELLHFAD